MAASSREPAEAGRDPSELDPWIDRLDRLSAGLVLLEPVPLHEIEAFFRDLDRTLSDHLASARSLDRRPRGSGLEALVRADHERLPTSLDQLWWFYGIVARDDHGGHRQALGQYGRLLAEALRRHRDEEVAAREPGSATPGPGRPAPASGKP